MSQACHRSLYGYQIRTALALAIENPHVAVTFLPLACTGATIEAGVLGSQRARELNCTPDKNCPSTVPAQITQLQRYLAAARRTRPNRTLDLVLLTVGANDIDFSGLVANVIIDATARARAVRQHDRPRRSPPRARSPAALPGNFAKLRAALKPMVGGDLSRVVFVSYGNPGVAPRRLRLRRRADAASTCIPPSRWTGIACAAWPNSSARASFPCSRAIVTCAGNACGNPADRMTYVDAHQQAFMGHGVCARSEQDPEFDRACFLPDGKTFASSPVQAATEPLTCGAASSEFRAYAPRARWVRTANDAYFVAMTYPEGLPATLQPTDIHDATWGVVSAVYGGAVHPTAEGHAAMADAARCRRAASAQPRRRTRVGEPRSAAAATTVETPAQSAERGFSIAL